MAARHPWLIALVAVLVAGCAERPDFEAELGSDPPGSDFPRLLPVDDILSADPADPTAAASSDAALAARVAALRARAAALRAVTAP